MIEVVECLDSKGVSPFDRWRRKLDGHTSARIILATSRLASGNFSSVKGAGSGVFEMRLEFGPGFRIYFGKDGERLILLLGGGTKQRQSSDIEAAQALWREYKQTRRRRAE